MRYKCSVSYDGSLFHGFQTQKGLRTVQQEIENVLLIIYKHKTPIYASGRTDAGVHSLGQVFHFDADIIMKEWQVKNALNSRLPRDIYINKVEIVNQDFHARFSAKKKTYMYIIDMGEYNPLRQKYCYYVKRKLDVEKMIVGSKYLIGEHDFKTFTKNHTLENTIRTIEKIDFNINLDTIEITFVGNGFLHNMVRIIVAMLIEVGRGKMNPIAIQEILEKKDRKYAPKIAPANGLYLISVEY